VTVSLAGGSLDGLLDVVDGQPSLELGGRYILFVADDFGSAGNSFLPIVGLWQGAFKVGYSAQLGRGLVHDLRGLPLVSIERTRLELAMPDSLIPPERKAEVKARSATQRRFGTGQSDRVEAINVLVGDEDPGSRVTEDSFLATVRAFGPAPKQE
jgi:hypothetical protein